MLQQYTVESSMKQSTSSAMNPLARQSIHLRVRQSTCASINPLVYQPIHLRVYASQPRANYSSPTRGGAVSVAFWFHFVHEPLMLHLIFFYFALYHFS